MSRNTWIILLIVAVIILGGWFLMSSQNQTPPQTNPPTNQESLQQPVSSPEGSASAQVTGNMVMISSTGFTPATLTIKVGDEVTWKNDDSKTHTVNSDPHPAHTTNPEINDISAIPAGESKSLTFSKAGTYMYHDHLNPSLTGTVIVE